MSEKIDISKMDKANVLAALYNNARPQGMGLFHYTSEPMDREKAQEILDAGQTYFDYLGGKVMKVDLGGDELHPGLYDRDNGAGAASAALSGVT